MLRFTQLSVLSNDSVQDLLDNYIRDENVKKIIDHCMPMQFQAWSAGMLLQHT